MSISVYTYIPLQILGWGKEKALSKEYLSAYPIISLFPSSTL